MRIKTVERNIGAWFVITGLLYLSVFVLLGLALLQILPAGLPGYDLYFWAAVVFGLIALIMGILSMIIAYGMFNYSDTHYHCVHCENEIVVGHSHGHQVIHKKEVR